MPHKKPNLKNSKPSLEATYKWTFSTLIESKYKLHNIVMLCWVMPLQNVGPAGRFVNGTWNWWLSGRRGYTVSGTDHWFVSDYKSLKCFSHSFVCFMWKRSCSKLEDVLLLSTETFSGRSRRKQTVQATGQ